MIIVPPVHLYLTIVLIYAQTTLFILYLSCCLSFLDDDICISVETLNFSYLGGEGGLSAVTYI